MRNFVRWDEYLREVIELRDSVSVKCGERDRVYYALMDRFRKRDDKSKEELGKFERFLYIGLRDDKCCSMLNGDKMLSEYSSVYRDSKQRYEIIMDRERYFERRRKEEKSEFKEVFEYIEKVKKYLSSLKELKDYRPPGE